MITAAQLLVKVQADTKGAADDLSGFGKIAAGVGIASAAAVVGIGVASVKMAADFQQGLTSLVTGAGESKANLGLVSDGILKMAVDTGTSTAQLTSGMYEIESAGYHGAAGLDVLKASAEGAKVGNADLGVVADATTTLMTDFGIKSANSAQAVNALITTVANGKTHMQDLAASLSQVAPTAAAAHVGLSDMLGAMATMTGEGVPAANAATYLRQTIIALDAPSAAAKKAMEGVGLSSSAVASEMQKSLPDALAMITDAVGKKFPVGSAAYVEALKNISGGSKTMQGMLDLTGSHLADFQTNVGKVGDAATKSGSQITGWSEVQNDFNFKMDRAKEVVETLMIGLGQHLLPVVGAVVDAFSTHLVPAITAVTSGAQRVASGIGNVITFLQSTGPAADAVKAVLVLLGGAMAGLAAAAIPKLVVAIGEHIIALGGQAAATWAVVAGTIAANAPFVLIGAAIAAVVAIVILIVTHFKEIQQVLGDVGGAIKGFVGGALGALGGGIDFVVGKIGGFLGVLGGVKDFILGGFHSAINGVTGLFQSVFGGLAAIAKAPIDLIIDGINIFIRALDAIQIHIPSVGVGPVHTPSFDWNGLKIGQIPQLAEGGTLADAGAFIVGDAGPELLTGQKGASVIPLPANSASQLAAGLSPAYGMASQGGQGGAGVPINLYIDGQRVAQILMPRFVAQIRNATGTRSF